MASSSNKRTYYLISLIGNSTIVLLMTAWTRYIVVEDTKTRDTIEDLLRTKERF